MKDCHARSQKPRGAATFLRLLAKIEDEPQWRGALQTNAFTETMEVCTPFPPKPGQIPGFHRAMRDEDALEALAYWQGAGFFNLKKGTVWDVLALAAARNSYHPVRDRLDGLVWDQQGRVDRLFLDYFPGELPHQKAGKQHDEVTRSGAERLAAGIRQYWLGLGFSDVRVWVDTGQDGSWAIRSNLTGGLPPPGPQSS